MRPVHVRCLQRFTKLCLQVSRSATSSLTSATPGCGSRAGPGPTCPSPVCPGLLWVSVLADVEWGDRAHGCFSRFPHEHPLQWGRWLGRTPSTEAGVVVGRGEGSTRVFGPRVVTTPDPFVNLALDCSRPCRGCLTRKAAPGDQPVPFSSASGASEPKSGLKMDGDWPQLPLLPAACKAWP